MPCVADSGCCQRVCPSRCERAPWSRLSGRGIRRGALDRHHRPEGELAEWNRRPSSSLRRWARPNTAPTGPPSYIRPPRRHSHQARAHVYFRRTLVVAYHGNHGRPRQEPAARPGAPSWGCLRCGLIPSLPNILIEITNFDPHEAPKPMDSQSARPRLRVQLRCREPEEPPRLFSSEKLLFDVLCWHLLYSLQRGDFGNKSLGLPKSRPSKAS
jgi:hypothetical protein